MSNERPLAVGDVCELIDPLGEVKRNTRLLGLQVTITGALGSRIINGELMHEIQFQDGGKGHAAPRCLRRIPPKSDYDGNQAGSWDLCPFNPYKARERA